MPKTEIQLLVNTLTHTFEKNAWHGPAVAEALQGITPAMANHRVGTSHNILELVAHMTAWRNFVAEKLEGNDTFEITDDLNFPTSGHWPEVVTALYKSQERLLNILPQTPASLLDQKVPGRPYTFRIMLNGIIHHDLYHTGQIVLLKKSG